MKKVSFLLMFCATCSFASGSPTYCKINNSKPTVKALSWDALSRNAMEVDGIDRVRKGKVTLIGELEAGWKIPRTNIFVEYEKTTNGRDAAEYVVFPTAVFNEYRVMGVEYVKKGESYHLGNMIGNFEAFCISD